MSVRILICLLFSSVLLSGCSLEYPRYTLTMMTKSNHPRERKVKTEDGVKKEYTTALQINSFPKGSNVYVNGKLIGKAPMVHNMPSDRSGNCLTRTVITAIPEDNKLFTKSFFIFE